ncbi:unnamed protein product [Rhizophagus irregularis]|nr:unnamed protein product [Rhizophagus irregularis]
MTLYAPQEIQNTNIEYNSSDEDLVSHISKWRCIESISEFDRYLNADQAQALCDTLNWWKLFGWRRIGYSGKLWMNNLHQKKMIDIISYNNLTSLQHNVENVWKIYTGQMKKYRFSFSGGNFWTVLAFLFRRFYGGRHL